MKGLIFVNPFLVPKESIFQAQRLREEFNNLGVQVEIISDGFSRAVLKENGIDIDLSKPDFAIYLDKDKYLSKALENYGIRLFNRHDAVRVCDDKAETYIALSNKGIKIPKTIFGALCYNQSLEIKDEWADKIATELKFPLIVKESYGSMGKGIYKVDDRDQLISVMQEVKLKPHLYQEYIPYKSGVDVRVIVIGGKAVASMERINKTDFRSNVARGGEGREISLTDEFRRVAESCAKILGLDYCGVDLLYSEGDYPIVCEVNSNAFFGGIESATKINVARLYAEHVIKTIESKN